MGDEYMQATIFEMNSHVAVWYHHNGPLKGPLYCGQPPSLFLWKPITGDSVTIFLLLQDLNFHLKVFLKRLYKVLIFYYFFGGGEQYLGTIVDNKLA